MSDYSDFVRDDYTRPIRGALVQLFAIDGSTLIDTDTTGADGQFTVTGPDAKYLLQVSYGGSSERSIILVGDPPEYVGLTGPANSTYTSLAALKAAPSTNASYILTTATGPITYAYVTGNFTGKADDVNVVALNGTPLANGALVRQSSDSVTFTPNVSNPQLRGSGIKVREIEVSITDKAGVIAGTNVDYSIPIQELIDYKTSLGGGTVAIPDGNFHANLVMGHQVSLRGRNRGASAITAATAQHVIRTPTGISCNSWTINDLSLVGDLAHTDCDVIHLETTAAGTFLDRVTLRDVLVVAGGRHGIHAIGTNSSGPFVQLLHMDRVESRLNNKRSLQLTGTVLETKADHCSFTSPLDATAGASAVQFDYNGDYPLRFTATNCLFSNPAPGAAGLFGPAVRVNAGGNINFLGCNFEFFQTGIYTEDFVFARGVNVIGCNFAVGPGDTVGAVLWLKSSYSSVFQGNTIRVGSGGSLVDVVRLDNGPDKVRMPIIGGNDLSGNIASYVKDVSGHIVTINGDGNAIAWRDAMALLPNTGAADDLIGLIDEAATTTRLVRGQRATIYAQSGTITVKHGVGNIYLNGAADYALSGVKSVTLVWTGGVWLEAGRS